MDIANLADVGLRTASAGTHAIVGNPASWEMKKVAAEIDLDLGEHRSTPVEVGAARDAALIYVMERSHAGWLLAHTGTTGSLLGADDIDDPYGRELNVYRSIRDEVVEAIRIKMPEIVNMAALE